jgi:hypothetical protein
VPSSVRRKLSALSALFDYICEHNAVSGNPVDGVKPPIAHGNEGSMPALGDAQARKLLEAPPGDTLKGCATAPFPPPCSITTSAVRRCTGSGSRTIQGRQGILVFRGSKTALLLYIRHRCNTVIGDSGRIGISRSPVEIYLQGMGIPQFRHRPAITSIPIGLRIHPTRPG